MNADDGNSVQGLGEGRQLGFIALHESIVGRSSSMNSFPSPKAPAVIGAGTFLAVRIPDLVANSISASCSARMEVMGGGQRRVPAERDLKSIKTDPRQQSNRGGREGGRDGCGGPRYWE